jgi:hypothetical protein
MMVMTVLQAWVAPTDWATLVDSYKAGTRRLPEQMVESFLLQNKDAPSLWDCISLWRSREALKEYQTSVETPGGIMMFRAAGAEPILTIYEVVANGNGSLTRI